MKKISLLIVLAAIIFSCSKKEEKFELFSAEAFAYSMDSGWELNASCRAKGFQQNETNNIYKAQLSFTIDLTTPNGKLFSGINNGTVDQKSKETFSDLPVETQIQLDSTYKAGKYILSFNVSDKLSGRSASIKKEFVLE